VTLQQSETVGAKIATRLGIPASVSRTNRALKNIVGQAFRYEILLITRLSKNQNNSFIENIQQ
jgi:hypothetical protein